MAVPNPRGLLQQLTPLGRRLISSGSVMASATGWSPPSSRGLTEKKKYPTLRTKLSAKSRPDADPRLFTLVNPFSANDSPVQVVVVGSKHSAEHWSARVLEAAQHDKVIGFDLEWKPTFTKVVGGARQRKTALMQLSVKGVVLLIQLGKLGYIPAAVKQLLYDKTLIKVGVGIKEDLNRLSQGHGLEWNGFHDVGVATSRVVDGTPANPYGLRRVVQSLSGYSLQKSKTVRMSNWENVILEESQVLYAAMDALVGREAYLELKARGHLEPAHLERLMDQFVNSMDKLEKRRAVRLASESDAMLARYKSHMTPLDGGEQARGAQGKRKKASEEEEGEEPPRTQGDEENDDDDDDGEDDDEESEDRQVKKKAKQWDEEEKVPDPSFSPKENA